MIVRRSMHPSYRSNAYLVADEPGGTAVFIDTGAPIEPLLAAVDEHALQVTHVLNTHEHHDHTTFNVELLERFDVPLVGPGDLADDEVLETGGLRIRALATPGHTTEHLAFLVNDDACFTGDVLFRGTVGGTMNGGPDGFSHLRASVLDRLLGLDDGVVVHPGHSDPTTIGDERADNPFVRAWLGADEPGDEPAQVAGRPCTLLVWGPDYDGGHKAWVRFEGGGEAIVGGSMVTRGVRT